MMKNIKLIKYPKWVVCFCLFCLLKTGFATAAGEVEPQNFEAEDSLEAYNRVIFNINKQLDEGFAKPVSQLYLDTMPYAWKHVISNFFSYLDDYNVLINDILQLEWQKTTKTVGRLLINTSFGMVGALDLAGEVGFERHNNDYGVTFAKLGYTNATYIVLPALGPSTIRDLLGRGISALIYTQIKPDELSWGLYGLSLLDIRANLLLAEKLAATIAEDEYRFIRDTYLRSRREAVLGETQVNASRDAAEEDIFNDIAKDKHNDQNNIK
jgi:phospholipid-binding lipoprotein MlaA